MRWRLLLFVLVCGFGVCSAPTVTLADVPPLTNEVFIGFGSVRNGDGYGGSRLGKSLRRSAFYHHSPGG